MEYWRSWWHVQRIVQQINRIESHSPRKQLIIERKLLTHCWLFWNTFSTSHSNNLFLLCHRSHSALATAPSALPAPAHPFSSCHNSRHHSHFELELFKRKIWQTEPGFLFVRNLSRRLNDDTWFVDTSKDWVRILVQSLKTFTGFEINFTFETWVFFIFVSFSFS